MTAQLSREELQRIVDTDHVQCGDAAAMARMLLAGMDSEPVGCDACGGNGSVAIDHGELGVEHMVCPKCAAAGIKLEVGE